MLLNFSILAAEAAGAAAERKPKNPIIPTGKEMLWAFVFFMLLFFALRYVLVPPLQRLMRERDEKIRADLEGADQAKDDVARGPRRVRGRARRRSGRGRRASSRAARAEADAHRAQLQAQADAEIVQLRAAAQAEIAAARDQALVVGARRGRRARASPRRPRSSRRPSIGPERPRSSSERCRPTEGASRERVPDDRALRHRGRRAERGRGETHAEEHHENNFFYGDINEVIWGSVAFLIVFALFLWKGLPAVKKADEEAAGRASPRRSTPAGRRKADEEAELARLRASLGNADEEAARILAEARERAVVVKADLKRRAETDIQESVQRARIEIEASKQQALADLARGDRGDDRHGRPRPSSTTALDPTVRSLLVDRYIDQVGARHR